MANNIVELGEGGGTSLGEVDRTRRGGERVLGLGGGRGGDKQPSLQQEEEGGKEKERAKARKRDNDKKIRE